MSKNRYQCSCEHCQDELDNEIAQEHRLINELVRQCNEKQRRQVVGFLAKQVGYGGIQRMAQITGLHRETIARGQRELAAGQIEDDRIRRQGGGRYRSEKKRPSCWLC